MILTKFQLFSLLTADKTAYLRLPDGRKSILCSIERESGCGRSFNVSVRLLDTYPAKNMTIHVQTSD